MIVVLFGPRRSPSPLFVPSRSWNRRHPVATSSGCLPGCKRGEAAQCEQRNGARVELSKCGPSHPWDIDDTTDMLRSPQRCDQMQHQEASVAFTLVSGCQVEHAVVRYTFSRLDASSHPGSPVATGCAPPSSLWQPLPFGIRLAREFGVESFRRACAALARSIHSSSCRFSRSQRSLAALLYTSPWGTLAPLRVWRNLLDPRPHGNSCDT